MILKNESAFRESTIKNTKCVYISLFRSFSSAITKPVTHNNEFSKANHSMGIQVILSVRV